MSSHRQKQTGKSNRAILILAPAAAVIAAFSFLAAFRFYLPKPHLIFILSYMAAFIACIAAARALSRGPGEFGGEKNGQRHMLIAVIASAFIFRIILLFGPPDDAVYRALWEGRLIREGYSPYSYSPDSSDLVDPRNESRRLSDTDPYWKYVGHPEFPSFFPPFALSMITFAGFISYSPMSLKIAFTFFDLCTIAVLLLFLRRRKMSLFSVILYAWNPIVLSSFALGAHHHSMVAFLLVVSVLLFEMEKEWAAFLVLGFAAMTNLLAFLIVPVFIMRAKKRGAALNLIWPCLPGLLSLLAGGGNIFLSFVRFGGHPDFHWNDSIHYLLSGFALSPYSQIIGRILASACFIALYIRFLRKGTDTARIIMAVLVAFLLFSPTVQPWFLTWFVPFLCIFRARPWLLWTGTVAVFYAVWGLAVESGTAPYDSPLIKLIEYAPVYGLFIYDFFRPKKEAL
ncbi:MAG: glycosyltransferase 87 family protein [Planctomycetota bacterium]